MGMDRAGNCEDHTDDKKMEVEALQQAAIARTNYDIASCPTRATDTAGPSPAGTAALPAATILHYSGRLSLGTKVG